MEISYFICQLSKNSLLYKIGTVPIGNSDFAGRPLPVGFVFGTEGVGLEGGQEAVCKGSQMVHHPLGLEGGHRVDGKWNIGDQAIPRQRRLQADIRRHHQPVGRLEGIDAREGQLI